MPTKISRLEVKIVPTYYKIRQLKICTSVAAFDCLPKHKFMQAFRTFRVMLRVSNSTMIYAL